MPRARDLPCARCGELMWRGTGVLPEGEATCRPCRREASGPAHERPQPVTVWACQHCGVECTRPPTRGQIPKWCSQRCADMSKQTQAGTCEQCGIDYVGHGARFCSRACNVLSRQTSAQARASKPVTPKPKWEPRGDLRRGYEDGDADLFFAALAAGADTTSGCWLWPSIRSDGYPSVTFGGRRLGLHRVVLEVKHGASLGSQHAHHVCATSQCVNPEHLQPVTHRDNIAEMQARQSYLRRIEDLESALAELHPQHPLLDVVAVV